MAANDNLLDGYGGDPVASSQTQPQSAILPDPSATNTSPFVARGQASAPTTTTPDSTTTAPATNTSPFIARNDPNGGGSGPSGGSTAPNAAGNTNPTTSQAFNANTWVTQALTAANSTDDPNYWISKISADPNVQNPATQAQALAYWQSRINQGDGAAAVKNGTVQPFNDSGGTGGTTFADPAYQALNSLAQQLSANLQQPVDFPQLDTLMSQLTAAQASNTAQDQQLASDWGQRVAQLQQPLLTQPEAVQQQALAENNLLASRDAALQNAKDSQSARGFAPTSGLAQDQAQQINQNAGNQVAQIQAQLAQSNIGTNESRLNEATQLQGLITQALQGGTATNLQEQAQNADLENQLYQTNQQRATQALAADQIPVDLTNQGYSNAAGAVTSPSSGLSALMPLITAALGQQSTTFNQSNSQASGLSSIISTLLQNLQ